MSNYTGVNKYWQDTRITVNKFTIIKSVVFTFSVIAILIASADIARASPPPLPEKKAVPSGYIGEKIAKTTNEKSALEEQLQNIETDLKTIRSESVDLAENIQINEAKLESLESDILDLETKSSDKLARLQQDQTALARLVMGLQKMRRMPPEAIFLRPGQPEDIARSALLLSHVVPDLHMQAKKLESDLKELRKIRDELAQKRDTAQVTTEKLKQEEKRLNNTLAARKNLYQKTAKDLEEKQKDAQELARQAQNVRQLVQKLQPKPVRPAPAQSPQVKPSKEKSGNPANIIVEAGVARMPVRGRLKVNYDEIDHLGAKSQGIRIETRAQALVVAPMGGVVRFAGPFKKFGNVIIMEHKGGYHSLIAGLGAMDVLLEQNIGAGEPIGRMDSLHHVLYYELRRNGKPIDPARKLKIARAL